MFGIDDLIGGVLGGAASFFGASQQKKALESLKLAKPQYEDVGTAQQGFADQGRNLPAVADLLGKSSTLDNEAILARLQESDPSAVANTQATSQLASDRAMGGLQPDTIDAIKRANAYSSLQGGYAGSSMADDSLALKTNQARLNAIKQAPGLNTQAMTMATELAPVNPDVAQTLISPGAILQRDDQEANYNNDILNQGRLAAAGVGAGNATQQASAFTTGITSLVGGIDRLAGPSTSIYGSGPGYGFGQGDTGPTSDSNFTAGGTWTGGWG